MGFIYDIELCVLQPAKAHLVPRFPVEEYRWQESHTPTAHCDLHSSKPSGIRGQPAAERININYIYIIDR